MVPRWVKLVRGSWAKLVWISGDAKLNSVGSHLARWSPGNEVHCSLTGIVSYIHSSHWTIDKHTFRGTHFLEAREPAAAQTINIALIHQLPNLMLQGWHGMQTGLGTSAIPVASALFIIHRCQRNAWWSHLTACTGGHQEGQVSD